MAHKEVSEEFGSDNIALKERYLVCQSKEYRLLGVVDCMSTFKSGMLLAILWKVLISIKLSCKTIQIQQVAL